MFKACVLIVNVKSGEVGRIIDRPAKGGRFWVRYVNDDLISTRMRDWKIENVVLFYHQKRARLGTKKKIAILRKLSA